MKSTKLRLVVFLGILFASLIAILPQAVNYFVASVLRMPPGDQLTESVRFFLLEVPQILMLLCTVVFILRIIRSYFAAKTTLTFIKTKSPLMGNVVASLFGIITPFCSCGVVPLFLGVVQTGAPLGASLSLLIAAPMINEIALVLLLGLFGWQTALLYVGTGLFIAITSGYITGKLGLERYIEDWVFTERRNLNYEGRDMAFDQRMMLGFTEVRKTLSHVWLVLVLGMAVGSAIHGYVPPSFMTTMMGKTHWWSVPLAVLVGIPLYMNAAGIIPIMQALLSKGAALGTSLAFMMSVIGLSLPEFIVLRRVLKLPLLLSFVGIVAVGIVIVGYVFNLVY
jgi:hypothetical protein